MSNFDEDEEKFLAEFAGFDFVRDPREDFGRVYLGDLNWVLWRPWSTDASFWQIGTLVDAVKDKGLGEEFGRKLHQKTGRSELSTIEHIDIHYEEPVHEAATDYEVLTEIVSASPHTICETILAIAGDLKS